MQLCEEWLEDWLELTCPDADERDRRRAQVRDPDWWRRRFVAVVDGRAVACAWLGPIEPGWRMLNARTLGAIDEAAAALVYEAVAAADGPLECRIPVQRVTPALTAALSGSGGSPADGRIEFRTPLAELPDDPGTLEWAEANPETAARLLVRTSAGSPDGLDEDEDPRAFIAGWSSSADRVVHVGQRDGGDVALVCARVEPDTGWSTLTWMGLVPEARGRGLGHAVHRHGIASLRTMGGLEYHGGTSLGNAAMRACFVRQGCREWRRFEVWRWGSKGNR